MSTPLLPSQKERGDSKPATIGNPLNYILICEKGEQSTTEQINRHDFFKRAVVSSAAAQKLLTREYRRPRKLEVS
jgi:hypothetical protein